MTTMFHHCLLAWQCVVVVVWLSSESQVVITEAASFNCDFESNLCGWHTADWSDGNWTRTKFKTPTSETGPDTGHTNNAKDFYIYLEVNDFMDKGLVIPGKGVSIVSPAFSTCMTFTFYYHMYGIGIGNLTSGVISHGSGRTEMWSKTGNQNNSWQFGSFHILNTESTSLQVYIDARTGDNIKGDTAVDDLHLYTSPCYPSTTTTTDVITNTTRPTEPDSGPNEQDSLNILFYIIPIPIVVLVVAAIVGIVCYCRRKDMPQLPPNQNVEDDDVSSIYNELNETAITSQVTQNGNVIHSEDNNAYDYADPDSAIADPVPAISDPVPYINYPVPAIADPVPAIFDPADAPPDIFTAGYYQSRITTPHESDPSSDYLEVVNDTGYYQSPNENRMLEGAADSRGMSAPMPHRPSALQRY